MTVNNPLNQVRLVCDGIGTTYNYTFETTLNSAEIFVYRVVRATSISTLQVEGVDYTIVLNANKLGGVVTSLTVWPSTDDVIIIREVGITQGTEYPDTGTMTKAQIENAVDRLTMICQQIDEALDRTLKIDIGDDSSPSTVPTLVAGGVLTNDGAALQWNADLIVNAGAVPGATNPGDDNKVLLANAGAWSWQAFTISLITDAVTVMKTFLGSATLAAARTNLGLGTVATLDTGVTAGDVPVLDAGAQLPIEIRTPRGHIDGLTVSVAADADHDRTIAVGTCRDSADAKTLVLASAMTKQIDAAWAVGNNAGGLFTGTVANDTWYHLFIIEKTSDGTIDAGWDTDITATNIPTGYSAKRRIRSFLTDGSANLIKDNQSGDWVMYHTAVPRADIINHANSSSLRVIATPPFEVIATVRVSMIDSSPVGTERCLITSPDGDDVTPTDLNNTVAIGVAAANPIQTNTTQIRTNSSSQIRSNTAGATTVGNTIRISVIGYIDLRGKDT